MKSSHEKKIQPEQVVPLIPALTVVLFNTTQTVCHQEDLTTFLFFSAASGDTQSESKWLQTDLDKNAKERDTNEQWRKVHTIIKQSIDRSIYPESENASVVCLFRCLWNPESSTKDILHRKNADHIYLIRPIYFTCFTCSVKPCDLILQLRKHHANTLKRQFHIFIDNLLLSSLINALLKTSWNSTNLE